MSEDEKLNNPTPGDRAEVHRLARAVLEAVRADSHVGEAAGLNRLYDRQGKLYVGGAVDDLLCQLSLEITAQSERIAEQACDAHAATAIEHGDKASALRVEIRRLRALLVEACDIYDQIGAGEISDDKRIAASRAAGSGK